MICSMVTQISHSTVGSSFSVSFSASRDELDELIKWHKFFREWNFSGYMPKVAEQTEPKVIPTTEADWEEARKLIKEQTEQKWTKENCKGCKYNEYPYDESTCFIKVCINGNKYEPKQTEPSAEEGSMVADCPWK